MKCEDASESISALCDGERIPREAAEHIGVCELCCARLRQYSEMGAELRRVASLEWAGEVKMHRGQSQRFSSNWWWRGWEPMRIPRFAFALLMVAVVLMGSSLVIGKVRAYTKGRLFMVIAKPAEGHTVLCGVSPANKDGVCESIRSEGTNGGRGLYKFRIISDDGERVQLGIRSARIYHQVSKDDLYNLPETTYWLKPGETLHIDVPGAGDMAVNVEEWDHYPSPGELWDHMQALANCRL
jgi:hypothetical protein